MRRYLLPVGICIALILFAAMATSALYMKNMHQNYGPALSEYTDLLIENEGVDDKERMKRILPAAHAAQDETDRIFPTMTLLLHYSSVEDDESYEAALSKGLDKIKGYDLYLFLTETVPRLEERQYSHLGQAVTAKIAVCNTELEQSLYGSIPQVALWADYFKIAYGIPRLRCAGAA